MSNETIYPFGCLIEIVKSAKYDENKALKMMKTHKIPEKISIIIGYNKAGDYELKAVDAENNLIAGTRSVLTTYTGTLQLVSKLVSEMQKTKFRLFGIDGISDLVIENSVFPGNCMQVLNY